MNTTIFNSIRENTDEVLRITFPLCKNENKEISELCIKLNKLAHKIYEDLEKLKSE